MARNDAPRGSSRTLAMSLALATLAACGSSDAKPAQTSAGSAAAASAAPAATAKSGAGPATPAAPAAGGPKLDANERADLQAMCAAVDKDYIDGTLSDYFAGLEATSAWGKSLRTRADESPTPGRVLEAAARERGWAAGSNMAPSCAKLFEYLDDVE